MSTAQNIGSIDINSIVNTIITVIKSIFIIPFRIIKSLPTSVKIGFVSVIILIAIIILIITYKNRHKWKTVQY